MAHSKDSVFRLPPQCYLHVLDTNTNITRLEVGPQTFVRKDHECVVVNATSMINIPPQHYCEILNPVVKDEEGKVVFDALGSVKLRFGDSEIRLHQEPFPFHPGEIMKINVTPLKIVQSNCALKLKALINIDEGNIKKVSGDEWLFEGPGVYIPVKGVQVVEEVQACVILINHALRLKATKEFVDRRGVNRVTGEEWLIKKVGSYIPDVFEHVIKYVSEYVLTEKKALHLKALKTFKDDYDVVRKSGEEWLVTMHDTEIHIPAVYEEIVGEIEITTLTNRQYCVILDPVDDKGKPQLGKKKLVKGDKSFFLMPGENLECGIQNIYVLGENEGLILKAIEEFEDGTVIRNPGDRWLIRGPTEVIPPIQVEVLCKRNAIALDKNEGIYVRDINTGLVRSVTGRTYMLTENEELWEKVLPDTVEELLSSCSDPLADRSDRNEKPKEKKKRDKTKVVAYRVPHNAAVQIYDYKEKTARIHYGPDLVMLGPDEHFTQLSLSGGKPKRPNQIKSLCLLLGPDFCTDIIVVETSDHARLSLQVSYNWHFKTEAEKTQNTGTKLFSVPDFVGDACKALASRIRGTVAAVRFDDFHKNSARIIRSSVFGIDANNKVRDEFIFPQNNLCITSIDIQSVEPVDQRTRESLQKSVQLAIEITTKSQEASARHEADRIEQQAKGRLERQMITDQAEAEKTRTDLLELRAISAAVESTGQAKAEAQSRAESARIEGEANVEQAKLKAEASKIEAENELDRVIAARKAEIEFIQKQNELTESHAEKMANIEIYKFNKMIEGIGQNTLIEIAKAGPDADVRLLQSMGLQSTLITDGKTPINLFQTAQGLIKKSICAGLNVNNATDNDSI